MQKSFMTKFHAFLAGLFVAFFLNPAGKAFAVSEKLNLDLNTEPQPVPMPSAFDLLMKLIISLIIIGVMAYFTVKLLRKGLKTQSTGESIKILDHYALSMNKGIYVVSIADRAFVLGVADHSINLITEIDDDEAIEELERKMRQRINEPVISPGLLEKILPGLSGSGKSGRQNFSAHIEKQISKLKSMVDHSGDNSGEDKRNE